MDFPDGGLTAGDDGLADLAKGLTTDGIQTIGSVGSIPSFQSPGQIRKGGSFEGVPG
jgi:hypothetical protein